MTTKRSGRPNGRPRTPTELHVLRGNPGHRKLEQPIDVPRPDGVPPHPKKLKWWGREAWDLYWTAGKAWLAVSDIPILTQLCELHDLREQAMNTVRKEGMFVVSENTGRSTLHRLMVDVRGYDAQMRALWSQTFMTPTDRARANVKATEKDPLDEWLAK